MTHCDERREQWSAALAAGEVIPDEVIDHLASCADCRQAIAEMERLWDGLDALAAQAPEAELRRDFQAMLSGYRGALGEQRGAAATPVATSEALAVPVSAPLAFRPATGNAAAAGRTPASRRQRTLRRRVYQIGYGIAAMLAGIVVGVGMRSSKPSSEVTELRKELRALRQDVALSMLQQSSASARLQGVSLGEDMSHRDPQVLAAMLETLATDPSPNVRLAAVDALAPRAGEPLVQQRLATALRAEESPLVQIALADALLRADAVRGRRLVAPLATQPGVLPEVRQYVKQRLGIQT